jgi:hypothetical protein
MQERGRWQRLFADLEAEAAAIERAELRGEVADRTRREAARLRLVDRLRGAEGHRIRVRLPTLGFVEGRVVDVGSDWLLLGDLGGGDLLIPTGAVLAVVGLGRRSAEPGSEGHVGARLTLGHALRALAVSRSTVAITLADGSTVEGTIDRAGADFVEVATHPADEPRRATGVRRVTVVPFSAILAVRSR